MPSAEEKDAVLSAFERAGYPRAEAERVVGMESGWNPAAVNRQSNAAGLIQFMPSTLRSMGYTGPPFATLSPLEQVPWIERYLKGIGKRWSVPGDTYLAIFSPKFMGAPDDTVMYPVGSAAWRMNPALRSGDDGPITAASVRRLVLPRA